MEYARQLDGLGAIASLAHDFHVRLQQQQVRDAPAHLRLILGNHDAYHRTVIPLVLGHDFTLIDTPNACFPRAQ
jgi:hypothetical protein